MENQFEEMIKSFVQNYFESDAGQKAMLSAIIGCLNNQNLESIKRLLNTSSSTSNMFEYIEDLEHITNSISPFGFLMFCKRQHQFQRELTYIHSEALDIQFTNEMLASQKSSPLVRGGRFKIVYRFGFVFYVCFNRIL